MSTYSRSNGVDPMKTGPLTAARQSGRAEFGEALKHKSLADLRNEAFQKELQQILGEGGYGDEISTAEGKVAEGTPGSKKIAGNNSKVRALIQADVGAVGSKLRSIPSEHIGINGGVLVVGAKERAAAEKSRITELDASSEDERRRNWSNRFVSLGEAWSRKLRHCGWRQSLRMAFEVPALYSAEAADSGYRITKGQFMAAVNYAMIRNTKMMSATEFDDIFSKSFDAFDVEGAGTLDYREFCSAFLFFRVPASTDALLLLETWYRQWDGDVQGGVTPGEFLRALTTLCTTGDEALSLLKKCNVKALVDAPAAIAARRKRLRDAGLYVDPTAALVDEEGPTYDVEAEGRGDSLYVEHATQDTGDFGVPANPRMVVDVSSPYYIPTKKIFAVKRDNTELAARMGLLVGSRGAQTGPGRPMRGPLFSPIRSGTADDGRGPGHFDSEGEAGRPSTSGSRVTSVFKREPAAEAVMAATGGAKALPPVGDDDADAPWNRGSGTMTEVRVFYSRIKRKARGFPTTSAITANAELAREEHEHDARPSGQRRASGVWEQSLGIPNMGAPATRRHLSKAAIEGQMRASGRPDLAQHFDPMQAQRDSYSSAMSKAGHIRDLKAALVDAKGARKRAIVEELQELLGRPLSGEDDGFTGDGTGEGEDEGILAPHSSSESPRAAHTGNDPLKRTGVFREEDGTPDELGQLHANISSLPLMHSMLRRVLDPSKLPDGRINVTMIRHMVKHSPGLLEELHRLRLLRLPAVIRSAYLAWQLDTQIKLAQQRFEALREEVLTKRALALWRARQQTKWFSLWKSWVRYMVWRKVKINSLRARRATRRWSVWARGEQSAYVGVNAANTHYLISLLKKCFVAWHRERVQQVQGFVAREMRADAFRRACVLSRGFEGLRDHWLESRAIKHYLAWLAKKHFRMWVKGINMIKKEQANSELAGRVMQERLKATGAFLDKQEKERLAAAQAAAEKEAYEQFMADAEAAKEEARLAQLRAVADRKILNHRIARVQAEELAEAAAARKAKFEADFEELWVSKIEAAVAEARRAASEYCYSKEGRDAMKDDAKILLMAETVDKVSQAESEYVARFDMSDGCIHFAAAADPMLKNLDFPKGRPQLDLNMDAMQLREAMYVATGHYVAKKGVQTRDGMMMDKVKAWKVAREARLSELLNRRTGTILRRRDLKKSLRDACESVIDPYTGSLYYVDIHSGRSFDQKARLFKSEDVHTPPDWILRCDESTGEWKYAHRKVPWRTTVDPPHGYRMCYACGRAFARRTCPGDGCHGYLYCWGCFEAYHPRDDPQWTGHWDAAERLDVIQLTGYALEEAAAALERHKRRATAAAARAAAEAALSRAPGPAPAQGITHVGRDSAGETLRAAAAALAKERELWQRSEGEGSDVTGDASPATTRDTNRTRSSNGMNIGGLTIDTADAGEGGIRSEPLLAVLDPTADLGLRLNVSSGRAASEASSES